MLQISPCYSTFFLRLNTLSTAESRIMRDMCFQSNDSDVFVLNTEKHVTQLGVDKSSTKILRTGTTIISARGTVGKCALVGEPMAMNQSCYGINGNEGISDIFLQDIKFQIYKNEGMVVSCLLDWQFIGSHFAAYSHFKPKGIQHFEFSSQARRES